MVRRKRRARQEETAKSKEQYLATKAHVDEIRHNRKGGDLEKASSVRRKWYNMVIIYIVPSIRVAKSNPARNRIDWVSTAPGPYYNGREYVARFLSYHLGLSAFLWSVDITWVRLSDMFSLMASLSNFNLDELVELSIHLPYIDKYCLGQCWNEGQ